MRILSLLSLFSLFACQSQPQNNDTLIHDPHSYSQPQTARVTHLQWIAKVDFTSKTIHATATWTIQTAPTADELILDTKQLNVKTVEVDGKEVAYQLGDEHEIFGQALIIPIAPSSKKVSIHYNTSPHAEALQWLTPQQTAGKEHPFLFTQSQAILARSWIPCQDSPGIRFTYKAEVAVSENLIALMSAANPTQKNTDGVYHFEMRQPIPSYLLALTVGDIAFKSISDRSGVYAEPSLIDTVAWEFADLEKMIVAAEELYGPYQWDRYDVIVLPPSFPFGGMENPRLTFATPTLLAGDRSLTSVIAHELAHSWSGNLVTNATWNDFWLNEGFTVYFEIRIMEKLYGKDYADMLASLNLQDLRDEIRSLTRSGNSADTKLKLDLEGRNPDEGVSEVAYAKGYLLLRSIEEQHGRDKFDQFLNDYFADNAFKVMDTEGFVEYITEYYENHYNISLAEDFFKKWIYSEGLPDDHPNPESTRFKEVEEVMQEWKTTGVFKDVKTSDWSTHEWLHLLKNLPDSLTIKQMSQLDEFGKLTQSGNAEIITVWSVHAIRNAYEKAYPKIESFLINTGRRKFLMPLYSELIKTAPGRKWAEDIYKKARPNYHFVATNSLDKLILTSKQEQH